MVIMRRLKITLFHLRQMLRARMPLWYYAQYCKNRFFWGPLAKRIPPFPERPLDDFELHLLCQKSAVWMLIWAVYSFLYHSKLNPRIVIHDDGSFDAESVRVVEHIFPRARVLPKSEADTLLAARADIPQGVHEYRKVKNKLALKLADIFLLADAEKIIVLDSDILFYAPPAEIVDFIRGASEAGALISHSPFTFPLTAKESYIESHALKEKSVEHMNSGLIAYRRSAITLDMFLEYIENMPNGNDYFSEMTGWCALVAQTDFKFFPGERYIIKGDVEPGVIAKHFTSPRRFEMFAYGIDLVRSTINLA